MVSSENPLKRSSTSPLQQNAPDTKRLKRPYHHHHRLLNPVLPALPEPAITDDARVDHLMNRSIGLSLRESGFDIADPAALESFRNAAEEYFLKLASYVRQSMLSSRRTQPIPQDVEHAFKRHRVRVGDLLPHVKPLPDVPPVPILLPSPPPEEDSWVSLPFLGAELSGSDDRDRSAYIPKHFPQFPSKHTYRHTPVFTEREQDPRKIRERATEDGRHGEEALRKLARASFKDNQLGSAGREKRPWGRRMESMDSMFEKTVKGIAKKVQRDTAASSTAAPLEIDFGTLDAEPKPARPKVPLSLELPPVINCERDLWRRTTAPSNRRAEDKSPGPKDTTSVTRVESWVST
ncbi:TBP-associated factor 8 family protein [Aspergillus clavatus NRRL 1]|uniref:Transcription initiation factor TFIID subunit 8 n=1 Tax=Aspergillus clavatus (strain ATCC 1007 / CBS 513.65 / DSM 816 / NCTC 3887 / NRRL 1 / QM 1276 / 107) TaxID=344612 RepID=A1CLE4_ASPCL|nr:bromodomain associated protein [Aspergillus clavatus NRRL 1]EAW09968.1 bromodomain associated protein [Aspergillus clavatus NRRL 1]